jgi:hypothetical protein
MGETTRGPERENADSPETSEAVDAIEEALEERGTQRDDDDITTTARPLSPEEFPDSGRTTQG